MDKYKLNFNFDDQTKCMEFPKDTKVRNALIEFFKSTNSKIVLEPEKISFIYKANILNIPKNLDKSLEQIFKRNPKNCIIKVMDTGSVIGGGGPVYFCDMTKKNHEDHKLTSDGNTYRTTGIGINIYGICKGKNCVAFDKEVIVPIKKKAFDLIGEKYDLKCPECDNIIIPKTVGFRLCEYKVYGKKYENGKIESFSFIDKADKTGKIKYYNPNENGEVLMIELKFEVLNYL